MSHNSFYSFIHLSIHYQNNILLATMVIICMLPNYVTKISQNCVDIFHFRGGGTQWISEDQSYYCWILKSYSHFFLQTSVAIHNIIVSLLSSFYAFHSHRNWKSALKNPKSHLAIILTDKHQMNVLSAEEELLGTLTSDDGNGNGNSTKAIGLITKTTILHVHHAFFFAVTARQRNFLSLSALGYGT